MKHLRKYKKILFGIFAFCFATTLAFFLTKNIQPTKAADLSKFKAGNIISDYTMSNYESMSRDEINSFLHRNMSCDDYDLKKTNIGGYRWEYVDTRDSSGINYNYRIYFAPSGSYSNYHVENGHFVCLADETFNGQSAADIIYDVAHKYRINPQVLIVLLQKEQGLISDKFPNAIQYRSATGYGCPDTAACDSEYYGFKNQLENAAGLFRYVLDNGSYYKPVGNNYIQYNPNSGCGGSTVYIENRATAALYQYTPYQPNGSALNAGYGIGDGCSAYGNRNFYLYFSDWFDSPRTEISVHSIYPAPGIYTLNTISNKSLGFANTDNGAMAKITPNDGSDLQKFNLERVDERFFKLRNVASGRYLDVNGADTSDGTIIQLWDGNDTCAQRWTLEIVDQQSYKLRNACSYKSLDIDGAKIDTDNTKIQIWTENNSAAQKWVLTNTSPAPINNGIYNIATSGNKAIALSLENTANGTKVVTGDIHSAQTEQFQIVRGQDGYYHLRNVASNRYLDVANASDADGAIVQIYDENTSCAQRWSIQPSASGYSIKSACSEKSLDVNNSEVSTENVKIQIWSPNESDAQRWYFTTPAGRTIEDGIYMINSGIDPNYVLDIDGSNAPANGTNAQLWQKNGTNSQKYIIDYNEDTGYYSIKSIYTGRNLDAAGGYKNQGTNVQVWDVNSSCAQKWNIIPNEDNTYRITSGCSRLSLDANGGVASNGINVQLWNRNTSNAQRWKFIETTIDIDDQDIEDGIYSIRLGANPNYSLDLNGAISESGSNIQLWKNNSTCAQKWILKRHS